MEEESHIKKQQRVQITIQKGNELKSWEYLTKKGNS
jgi:hypothetical protein